MATTLSTGRITYDNQAFFQPKRVHAVATVALTSGTATTFAPFETHQYAIARAHMQAKHLAAATTLGVTLLTGPTSADITAHVQTSSGAVTVTLATTSVAERVFVGLNRWTKVVVDAGGAGGGGSTGLFVDLELV